MRIRQYSHFGLRSDDMSAAEMTARIGCEPDSVMVRGSKHQVPKEIPVWHGWDIVCDDAGLCVDDQIGRVVDRLEPHLSAIAELIDDCRARGVHLKACMNVARWFDGADGEEEELDEFETPTGTAVKLGGQHQLLGWHLDRRVLEFLRVTGAELDVDEYG